MCFKELPPELVLDISSYLESIDRVCLRLTCRGLRNWIQHNLEATFDTSVDTYHASFNDRMRWLAHFSSLPRTDLIDRLLWDSLVFKVEREDLCIKCLNVKALEEFSNTSGIMFDGRRICNACLCRLLQGLILPGHSLTYLGTVYYTCTFCGESKRMDFIHEHDDHVNGRKICMCSECHMGQCDDITCMGWPKGWIERYPGRFQQLDESFADLESFAVLESHRQTLPLYYGTDSELEMYEEEEEERAILNQD